MRINHFPGNRRSEFFNWQWGQNHWDPILVGEFTTNSPPILEPKFEWLDWFQLPLAWIGLG